MSDTITAERDFSQGCNEPRNSKGQTLAEYVDDIRAVHDALKADMFHAMGCRKKAKDVATMQHYDRRVKSLSSRLGECVKIGRHYGISLR